MQYLKGFFRCSVAAGTGIFLLGKLGKTDSDFRETTKRVNEIVITQIELSNNISIES